ncbi:TOMM precursor leader peptide-binding protein [Nocardiopsis xinjiangensis]|uniref:TOMM precursor leader peptide-binding protein n=1 Tax=Nocardiopsis xinjiangensis TaxID=124285 RepID=UPI000347FA87|nr:TOMM precursor leader peptide-binding protein [Nocardiopsis xinjiangensis]
MLEQSPIVLVLGDSVLASAVAAELGPAHVRRADDGVPRAESVFDAVISAADGPAQETLRRSAREAAAAAGVPLLSIEVFADEILIGPMVLPGEQGCDECARTRREAVREGEHGISELPEPEVHISHLAVPGAPVAAATAVDEATRAVSRTGPRTVRTVLHLRLADLSCEPHRFLPYPLCTECGDLPDDDPQSAVPSRVPRPKADRDKYRVNDLAGQQESLLQTYVDRQSGVIRKLEKATIAAYPYVAAPLAMPKMNESGFGRDLDYRSCTLTAVTEAVERIGGARPGGRRTVVRASRAELGDDALDPRSFGLHSEEQYALPGFRMRSYDDDLELNWVWGYSHTEDRPVLVPEGYAYYRAHNYGPDTPPFVYEISNGCALGGCPEEAVFHGLIELVERDSFLMTWYGRLPAARLDLSSASDPTLPLMAERLAERDGYQVHAFDTTMEHGIPSVWVMAVHPGDDPRQVKAFCAGGAGFDPERALAAAVLEMAVMIPRQSVTLANEYERVSAMVEDPRKVRVMDDHSLLYAHPKAFERFAFLFGTEKLHPIGESFADAFRPRHTDIGDDLRATVARLSERGLQVVSVDQTTAEHEAGGFSCAKVIVPGLVPMTFGYDYRRLTGLPRLLTAPKTLGYRDRHLVPDELNPHPHPFP